MSQTVRSMSQTPEKGSLMFFVYVCAWRIAPIGLHWLRIMGCIIGTFLDTVLIIRCSKYGYRMLSLATQGFNPR